jgi:hypothetical protein
MKYSLRAAALAIAALFLSMFTQEAAAQVVSQQPTFIAPFPSTAVTDFGNGPLELRPVAGNALIGTALGTGTGSTSGSSTTLTLTGTPTVPPCVGCIISGAGITSGTTVAAFNGTTTITLSAAMTVAASTPLSWGAACPAGPAAGAVGVSLGVTGLLPIQAGANGVTTDVPLYTQARICGWAQNAPGAQVLAFPIGAH